jgi:hypothetical protein
MLLDEEAWLRVESGVRKAIRIWLAFKFVPPVSDTN